MKVNLSNEQSSPVFETPPEQWQYWSPEQELFDEPVTINFDPDIPIREVGAFGYSFGKFACVG